MPTFTIPENVTRLGLYWYPRSTMNVTYSRLFRQVVAVAAGQQYRVDYFNWADLASNARGTLRLTNVNNGKYLDTANGLVYLIMIFFELPLVLVYLCFPATYCIADIIERLKVAYNSKYSVIGG